ncbi:hypothetical protein SSX86_032867 [Deinandra increscens subsp. villosa]|uniref:Uncharacterized protein n=1 Tax=Deinandra increscens subsp. villosa TaxID=3103831 RepID=A0AAP0C6E4_9ASTR
MDESILDGDQIENLIKFCPTKEEMELLKAVLSHFSGGLGGSDDLVANEIEVQQHQKLEKLYISTRSAKHFQRDIVRGVEGFIVVGSKQVEIGTKLSEDSRKYGAENTCTSGSALSKAAVGYSSARMDIERERENLLKSLGTQFLTKNGVYDFWNWFDDRTW